MQCDVCVYRHKSNLNKVFSQYCFLVKHSNLPNCYKKVNLKYKYISA